MKSYKIIPEQGYKLEEKEKYKLFYVAKRLNIKVGSSDDFIISSKPDGQGDFGVDDSMVVVIREMGYPNRVVSFNRDFSNGCKPLKNLDPLNLNAVNPQFDQFRNTRITCTIKLFDKCGGYAGSSDIFLTLRPKS